jgi:hypothetical protein
MKHDNYFIQTLQKDALRSAYENITLRLSDVTDMNTLREEYMASVRENRTIDGLAAMQEDVKSQLQFTNRDKTEVIAYVVLMVLGLLGNISAIAFLVRSRYRRSRIHLLLLNLTGAV